MCARPVVERASSAHTTKDGNDRGSSAHRLILHPLRIPVIGNGFEVAVSGSSRDMQSVMYDDLAWLQISRAMHLFLIDLQGEIDVLDRLMYRRSRINVNLVVEVTRDVLFREPSRALEQEGCLADPLLLQ